MGHVDAAVTEMFRAVHMQLLGNTCRLEKLLLAALVMETRATGADPPVACLLKLPDGAASTFVFRQRRAVYRLVRMRKAARLQQASGWHCA